MSYPTLIDVHTLIEQLHRLPLPRAAETVGAELSEAVRKKRTNPEGVKCLLDCENNSASSDGFGPTFGYLGFQVA